MNAYLDTLYIVISGAGTARRMPPLIERCAGTFERVLVVPTEHTERIISRRELALIDGIEVVDSYFSPAILPYPPEGIVLFAPCTFNSLNKLAAGIADTLALSIVSEAIGRRTPVIVALSVNPPLLQHPRSRTSMDQLRAWGVDVIPPDTSRDWSTMVSDKVLFDALLRAREAGA